MSKIKEKQIKLERVDSEAVIFRIQRMEQCLDKVLEAKKEDPHTFLHSGQIQKYLIELFDYYEGGQWLYDYECDDRGELPKGLKRGVLAQDTLYDLFCEVKNTEK